MNKRLLLIGALAVLILSLSGSAFADEKVSYTITITIPQIIEHSQLRQQLVKEDGDEKAEEEKSKDIKPYPFYEPTVIVKTFLQEP